MIYFLAAEQTKSSVIKTDTTPPFPSALPWPARQTYFHSKRQLKCYLLSEGFWDLFSLQPPSVLPEQYVQRSALAALFWLFAGLWFCAP